ncbi:MAG: arginine--tRNA ligase [Flavobacteriales bacterium]|nr:arginine--tRNA ligase [Flavobacteriales bacterium]MDG1779500.1 arginine--tRNA ligase [Flavobacteriales bacterium]MDG2245252.1 arginine--tRNA ligase [Flavobacteriales bacterium]
MTPIEDIIIAAAKKAVQELFNQEATDKLIQLQHTRKDFEGDFTLVTFPLVRFAKKSPEATGKLIGEYLVENVEELTGFNVVKGFLNLVVGDAYWFSFLQEIAPLPQYGVASKDSKGLRMVEYSSPNTNKPLHLGHLRNNFLGYSVAKILQANGHPTVKVQIINDRGIHICKSMVAWQKFGNGETPTSSGMKGDKLVGKYYVAFDKAYKVEIAELIEGGRTEEEAKKQAPLLLEAQNMLLKWEEKDAETVALWEKMNGWVYEGFEKTYTEMGVDFDKLYYESNTYLTGKDIVEKGLEQGVFYKREDGSVWIDLTEDGLDEKLVLRKDGTAVYMTQDIGTAIMRFNEFPGLESQIYTVGNEQEYHFKVLFLILEKLGFSQAKSNFHLSYGMVELPEGKMKSREGTVVDADDLLDEMAQAAQQIAEEQGKLEDVSDEDKKELYKAIGYGALKYFLLRVDPKKTMMFDPKESIDFYGNTGPFIQFNYVRTRALLRKAAANGIQVGSSELVSLTDGERMLLHKLYDFPATLSAAAAQYDPSQIANYVYDLVKLYSSFYQGTPILKEENDAIRGMRLELTKQTGNVIKTGMELLGIHMPERM